MTVYSWQYVATTMVIMGRHGCCLCCCGNAGNNIRVADHGGEQYAESGKKGQQLFEVHGSIMRCYDLIRQYVVKSIRKMTSCRGKL